MLLRKPNSDLIDSPIFYFGVFLEDSFSPKQIAAALKVSESSVKRWCDRGEIRTDRTIGGHRRIPLGFLLEFLESTNRRLVNPEAIGLDEHKQSITQISVNPEDLPLQQVKLEHALLNGIEEDCRQIVCSWFSSLGGVAPLTDDLICPVFRSIGDGWLSGRVGVFEERQGCEIMLRLIHELRRLIPEPSGMSPLAMGGTPSGDQYQLATSVAELVFREQGWRTINLGSNIPFADLLSAARKHMPRLFWLSISHVEKEDLFLEEYSNFVKRLPKGIILVVGGRALSEQLRTQLLYSTHCDGMRQLSTFAKSLKSGTIFNPAQTENLEGKTSIEQIREYK